MTDYTNVPADQVVGEIIAEIELLGLQGHLWGGQLYNLTLRDLKRTEKLRAVMALHRREIMALETSIESE